MFCHAWRAAQNSPVELIHHAPCAFAGLNQVIQTVSRLADQMLQQGTTQEFEHLGHRRLTGALTLGCQLARRLSKSLQETIKIPRWFAPAPELRNGPWKLGGSGTHRPAGKFERNT